jgi:ABC-type transport system involved in Fe-S cluster assembly fused permease/ATPase subunit
VVLLTKFDWRFMAVTMLAVLIYLAFTHRDRVAHGHPPPRQ